MRVTSVEQRNNSNMSGMLKAGVAGGLVGAAVRQLAPLTTDEQAIFFNPAAKSAIQTKVKNARINEANRIADEIGKGVLNISRQAGDTFSRSANIIAVSPKSAKTLVDEAPDAVKDGLKALISRVDTVGAVKEHIETNNIKNAAKSARPLAYFVGVGALVAMGGKMIANAFNALKSPSEKPQENKKDNLTMADVLLEGLGSNAEILFLTKEASNKE